MEKIFDSVEYTGTDALEAWSAMAREAVMPTACRLVGVDVFRGWFKAMALGPVQISAMSYSSFRSVRTPRLIRAGDPECLQIGLIRGGPHTIDQNRRHAPLRRGELMVFDSSRPFDSYADGESLLVQVPRALLPLRPRSLDPLLGRSLPGREGVGLLLADFLTRIADGGAGYSARDAARLGTVALDLAAAFLAHHLESGEEVPEDSRRRMLHVTVTAYIHRHLGDPTLSVSGVASAHHMSVRSLHRLFQDEGTSVAAWIRGERLDRCCRDLADPSKRHIPIHAIAARWGFPRPGDFTRAFRARQGITPSEYRLAFHAEGQPPGPGARPRRPVAVEWGAGPGGPGPAAPCCPRCGAAGKGPGGCGCPRPAARD